VRSRIREPSPIDLVDDYPLDEDADVEAVAQLQVPRVRRVYDERKHKDFHSGTFSPFAPVIIGGFFNWFNPLNGSLLDIPQGLSFNERTGDAIRVVRVGFKALFRHEAAVKQILAELPPIEPDPCYTGVARNTTSHLRDYVVRTALVLDKQPYLPVPQEPGLPWVPSTGDIHPVNAFRNTFYNERFDILHDEVQVIQLGQMIAFEFEIGGTNLPFVSQQGSAHRYEMFKDLDFIARYNDSPAGAGLFPAPNLYIAMSVSGEFTPCDPLEGWFNARVTYDDNVDVAHFLNK